MIPYPTMLSLTYILLLVFNIVLRAIINLIYSWSQLYDI